MEEGRDMTYRDNPPQDDDTHVVERERVVEREQQPVYQQPQYQQPSYQPPPQQQVYHQPGYSQPTYQPPPGGPAANVNVSGGGGGYAPVAYSPGPLYYARRVVALLFTILIVLLLLRVVLLLLGANQDNGLVNFIMAVTEPFVAPFRGIFSFDQVNPIGSSVLDVGALVAMGGYALLALLIIAILKIADRNPT